MKIQKSDVVFSTAGRDCGGLFFVTEIEENFAYLADGKKRKTENPKRKKLKHLRLAGNFNCHTAEKLRQGDKVSNSEIRRTLAEIRSVIAGEQGGM